ncbi:MAG: copper chaperone PCu(A)C [Chloroflexi bacterium]|nr:copper chaperone PCu(A)C [Chloroflexota bacterium]
MNAPMAGKLAAPIAALVIIASGCAILWPQDPVVTPLKPAVPRVGSMGSGAQGASPAARAEARRQAQPASPIVVERAWAREARRASMGAGGNSAAYLTLRNTTDQDDTLLSAQSGVADAVELHQSFMDNGVMRMRPAGPLTIPAGGTLVLEPGGYHAMLIGLSDDLRAHTTIAITLQFRHAGAIQLKATVQEMPGQERAH